MDYVQNKNVSVINEHKRAISEKKNPKIKKKKTIKCISDSKFSLLANMLRSMAVS